MCSAIVMYLRISSGQIVQPCPQGTPLGHWEGREQGGNNPGNEAAVNTYFHPPNWRWQINDSYTK